MILGKVTGTVVTTISHPHYKNRRLLVVQPLRCQAIRLGEILSPWTIHKQESGIQSW